MNVLFKRGLSAGLPTSGAIEGAFYLTTDTNRLYIGKNLAAEGQDPNVVPVELNQSITIKNNLAEAQAFTDALNPEAKKHGQFFYLAQENILAVYKDNQWVQINPDTNTNDNTKVVAAGTQAMVDNEATNAGNTRFVYDGITNGVAHYRLIVEQTTSHLGGQITNENSVIARLDLDLGDLVANSTAVDVTSSAVANNSTTISSTGAGSAGTGFTVTGGSHVTLSGNANALTIDSTDTTYELSSTGTATTATVALTSSAGPVDNIAIAGDSKIDVDGSTADQVAIKHKTSGVTAGSYGPAADAPLSAAVRSFTVPNFTVDDTGHITAASDKTVTLPDEVKTSAVSANAEGKITVTNSDGSTAVSNADLYYVIHKAAANGTVTEATVYNQGDLGTYYTKEAIDGKLQGLNALTYKGTIGDSPATVQSLPANPGAGDTYKVATAGTYNNIECQVGDLLIATGDEVDGAIASPNWTLVSSGSDTDTTYSFTTSGTNLIYEASTNPGAENIFATIAASEELSAAGNNTTHTINVTHNKVLGDNAGGTVGITEDHALSFNDSTGFKVPVITVNDYGHVTAISEHTVTLPVAPAAPALSSTGAVINLTSGGANVGAVTLTAGSHISVGAGTDANSIAISHTAPTTATANVGPATGTVAQSGTPLNYGDKFIVPNISYDDLGHIVSTSETTLQLPVSDDTTYDLSSKGTASLPAGTTGLDVVLADNGGSEDVVTIQSQTITLTHNNDTGVNSAEIVWGSF